MTSRNPRAAWLLAVICAFALVAAACGGDDTSTSGADSADTDSSGDTGSGLDTSVTGTVNVSGSSTVEPVSAAVAEIMTDEGSPIEVTVDGPGTGDGFALFCAGETDVSNASRTIKDTEVADCEAAGVEFVELKVAYDGIAVLTNPANESVECLTTGDLYALMGPESDGFDNWSDADAIATELGGAGGFPDVALDIAAPGPESGTYDSFIEIILEDIVEERLGEDADNDIRTDFSGNPDDNVLIQGIQGSESSFGWVGFAFANENADTVKAIEVDGGAGCTAATIETIADGSYPISRALYVYVNSSKAADNAAISTYIDYYLGDAYTEAVTKAFGDSGYVELPSDELADVQATWDGR